MSLRRLVTVALIAMAAFAVWAWTRTNQPPAPMSAGAPATTASPQVVVESGGDPGIEWKVPPRWSKVESNPMRRFGDPEADIGGAALLLASDDAAYITGSVLAVDGGMSAGL